MTIVSTVEELRALYGETSEPSVVKVTTALTAEYRRMIEASPFAALATVGPEGLGSGPIKFIHSGPVHGIGWKKTSARQDPEVLSSIVFDQTAHGPEPGGRDGFRAWTASESFENVRHFLHLSS